MAKIPRWRWWVWGVEVVLLLAVVEHFAIRPRIRKPKAVVDMPQIHGAQVEALGEAARLPDDLHEVAPSYYPLLEGLAEGSERMLETQKSVSHDKGLPVEVENRLGMRFRLVPSGSCLIGSPTNERGRGSIEVRHVQLFPEDFYMGKFEVTQAEWKRVMGITDEPSVFKGDKRPVEEVTWYDCQRFVNKLCELEGVPPNTYQLPTEAEWEYACRGGTDTSFCFGDQPDRLGIWADFAGNNCKQTAEIGRRRCNSLGLYDMHGNVWEWCRDLYVNYPGDDSNAGDRYGYRTIRGGNWYVGAWECRSANRCCLPPASHGNMLGFRVMRRIK